MGKTEKMTPLKKWLRIKKGQTITMRRSGIKRKVIDVKGACITLKKVRTEPRMLWSGRMSNSDTTVYVPCDRHFFIL